MRFSGGAQGVADHHGPPMDVALGLRGEPLRAAVGLGCYLAKSTGEVRYLPVERRISLVTRVVMWV